MPGCPRRNVLPQLVHLFAFTNKRRWTPPHDFFQGIFLPQNAIAPRNTLFSLVLPVPPVNCPPLPFCSGSFWFTLTALLCRKDPSEEEDQKKKRQEKEKWCTTESVPGGNERRPDQHGALLAMSVTRATVPESVKKGREPHGARNFFPDEKYSNRINPPKPRRRRRDLERNADRKSVV